MANDYLSVDATLNAAKATMEWYLTALKDSVHFLFVTATGRGVTHLKRLHP